jgi:ABC-2 type transport system permease protein
MRTLLTVLVNDYHRAIPRAASLAVLTIITLASIALGVYMTGIQQTKGHIVFVTQDVASAPSQTSSLLEVTVSSNAPTYAQLIEQKYDASVTVDSEGNYQVETLHGADYANMVLALLQNPSADVSASTTQRGVGVNIIGFMMMFLLMSSFSNLFVFADDKEQGQLRRVAATPISFGWYLAAHCVFCLSMLLPEFAMLAIMRGCGWDIGFTLWQYAGLMGLLAFLGLAFALLLHTLIGKPDNANMLGSSVTVLTSILAGSFYSLSRDNTVVNDLIGLLPQKEFMVFAQHLQDGEALQNMGSLLYTVAFALLLFTTAYVILKRTYVKNI